MGAIWLALGVLFWALSMLRFLPGFRRGELVTAGTFGWCRHPIYASLLMFWLPAVGLIAETWTFYVVAAIGWPLALIALGVLVLIGGLFSSLTSRSRPTDAEAAVETETPAGLEAFEPAGGETTSREYKRQDE